MQDLFFISFHFLPHTSERILLPMFLIQSQQELEMVSCLAKAILFLYETCFGKTRHLLNDKDVHIHLHLNESIESY